MGRKGKREGDDFGGLAGAIENGSGGAVFAAKIAHADHAASQRRKSGAGDLAGFFAGDRERRAGGRGSFCGEAQAHAEAVDLAAGTNAFDDFLAGVAAFRKADVRVFQAGFVRNLLFAEVVAEPRDALFEAEGVEGGVTGGAAAVGADGFFEGVPAGFGMFAGDEEFGGGDIPLGAAEEAGGEAEFCGGDFHVGEFGEGRDVAGGEFADDFGGAGAGDFESGVGGGFVGEGDVVHDDEFFECGEELFADEGEREDEDAVGEDEGFDFGEDVALGVEEERGDALAGLEVADVVGEQGIEVAGAVGAGEGEDGAVVFVEEGGGVAQERVLGEPVGEVVGEGGGEPCARGGASGAMQSSERGFDHGLGGEFGHG